MAMPDRTYSIEPFIYDNIEEVSNDYLLLTDSDLSFKDRKEVYSKYKKIFLISLSNDKRAIPINRSVSEFKDNAI